MIFITGDTHGSIDIRKLTTDKFIDGNNLTRSDYLIICGDFGLLWDDSNEEHYWLKWLDRKPWTTLWIDGNHENYDMINDYPVEEWNGTKVQKITNNIIHICRGSAFQLDGINFFLFGGAESHDKEYRVLRKSIWEEEIPTEEEIQHGREVLEKINYKTDIVITHSMPTSIQNDIFFNSNYSTNILTDFFEEIDKKLEYKMWFSGHYHVSMQYDEKHFLIFNNIVKLTENGFERVYPSPEKSSSYDDLPPSFKI